MPSRTYDLIDTVYRHNLWANTRLFALCAQLDDAQLNTDLVGGYGTVLDTLRHIAIAEQYYWRRVTTGESYEYESSTPPTLVELQAMIRESGAGLIEAAATAQAGDIVQLIRSGKPRAVPSAVILNQAVNHATEHRAQIMTILTQLGIQPPDLDSWTFFDEADA